MKKLIIIALAIATVCGVQAKKTKKQQEVQQPVLELKTSSDSLSYAAGYANAKSGLIEYLQNQLRVDTAYMADFVAAVREGQAKQENPQFRAYAAGLQVASMLDGNAIASINRELTDAPDSIERDYFYEGFVASVNNDTTVFQGNGAGEYIELAMKRNREAKNEKLYGEIKREGAAFLAENAKKDSVKTTASGLQYKILKQGTGAVPKTTDEVQVRYRGTLIDGTEFDSSYKRKDDVAKFKADRVIKGWTEALTMMPVGSTWELYIPYDIAYGDRAMGKIKPFSTLIFNVELVGITGVDEPAKAEKDAAATTTATAKKSTATKKTSTASKTKK